MKASETAVRLWNLLRQRPATYTDTEIKRDLNATSKTKLLQAVAELEDAGLITTEVEDE